MPPELKSGNYRVQDVAGFADEEILALLKAVWNYADGQPFYIFGQLEEVSLQSGNKIYFLVRPRSVNDGSALRYPLEGIATHKVYIGSSGRIGLKLKADEINDGIWVKARVELSPETERNKQKNPFNLQTVDKGVTRLQKIPRQVIESGKLSTHEDMFIENWVIDFYRDQHSSQIREQGDILQRKLIQLREQGQARISKLQHESETLTKNIDTTTENLEDKKNKLDSTLEQQKIIEAEFNERKNGLELQQKKAEVEFDEKKNQMELQLSNLKQFVEKQAAMLKALDLVGEDEANLLLGGQNADRPRQGHDFAEQFNSDPAAVVGYFQAFMWKNGIVYSRQVLEDFFALLKTHDLIILAGDSGSGKTNLVKSFAKAVSGEAVIIPVKPNWTSAEDLLGYYNPLDQKYLTTPFLDALFEASRNPEVPYFICLDEMNLARVEYYFADFLSLLEERGNVPEIQLYTETEAKHVASEIGNFIALIEDAKIKLDKPDLNSFLDILKDESLNAKLHELCGFQENDSLLKHHARLRKLISSYLSTPSSLKLPPNVRIIGTINMDETTHYLSPKILDRAHIVRFASPLLSDWDQIETELEDFDLDNDMPVKMLASSFGKREHYPEFNREDPLVKVLIRLVKNYLEPLGIEFGLRTVRQALQYREAMQAFGASDSLILNNIVTHKILPKLMFDGEKLISQDSARKDKLKELRENLLERLSGLNDGDTLAPCVEDLDRVIRNAESNDWVVNYWSR